jgi:F-type H+-transporting ATPase subunit epsilon
MPREFNLSVVAPDKSVVDERVTSVVAPGSEGYFGVMAGHLPLIAALNPGLLEYVDANNQRNYVYLGGGFAEVSGERMTVLADEADRARDIDLATAERNLEEARKALRGEPSEFTSDQAVVEIDRALNRIRAARASR